MPLCSENPGMPVGECYEAGKSALAQLRDDAEVDSAPKRNNTSDEADTEKIPELPVCDGSNGIKGVDCKAPKPVKEKKKSLAQNPPISLPIIDTSSLPVCNGTNGTAMIDCKPSSLI
jgi:hypothetical protein